VDVEDLETVQFDENADPVERHRLPSSESTQSGTETTQNPQDAEARNPGLARLLKKGTSRSHRAAENVHFVRDFMQHKVSADSYKELLGALFHVYSALEEELDRCSKIDSRVKAIHFPFLARKETLLQDLQYFHGSNYAAFLKPSSIHRQLQSNMPTGSEKLESHSLCFWWRTATRGI
jgi:hypothetical protein